MSKTSFILSFFLIGSCTYDKKEVPESQLPKPPMAFCDSLNVTYSNTIVPIINSNCTNPGCHAAGSSYGDYTSYSGIKAKVDAGTLKERVIVKKDMPPGNPLSPEDIKKIECWINAGAPEN